MTLDDALDSLASRGPSTGDGWKAWRETRAAAVDLLASLHPRALEPRRERLVTLCLNAGSDREAILSTVVPLVRLAREPSEVVPLLSGTKWRAMVVEALSLSGQHDECWPLLEALATSPTLSRAEAIKVLSKGLTPARFAALSTRAPGLAAHLAQDLAIWHRAGLAPYAEPLITLVCEGSGEVKQHALTALAFSTWSHRLGEPPARLEAAIPSAEGKDAGLLSRIVALEHLKANTAGVEALLRSSRAEVRLGAVEALAHEAASPGCWSRLVRAGVDDSALVREEVFRRARGLVAKQGLDEADARALAASLDGAAGGGAAAFLSFAFLLHPEVVRRAVEGAPAGGVTPKLRATLDAPGTRACVRCRELPRKARWEDRTLEPTAFSLLERVPGGAPEAASLLRCPACQAHFLFDSSSEHDVNSRRDAWWYERLTLRELTRRFAERVDLEHPRVKSWDRDLRADLEHVDPAVREEARWEVSAMKES